jgi:16S rRNA (cytidine1402-2'-O)-methyltransferase
MENATRLYLVPTPIGNLEDITLRALRILNEVDTILAEDTRTTGVLLKHHNINNDLKSYHIHNERQQVQHIVDQLKEGKVMALVSDAGTPGISDPGFLIVRECIKAGIQIECLPGATAFVPAIVKSGIPCDRFIFEGFLPHKKGKKTKLEMISESQVPVVCYESPHRLLKTLQQIGDIMGKERIVSVSRELTKIYEESITDSVEEVLKYFEEKGVKGEIVLIVSAKPNKNKSNEP